MKENKAVSQNSRINWYPGHMAKAKRQMAEDMKFIDVVVELVDARIPYSSKNPDIDRLAKGKARVILLNKADLADPKITVQWKAFYERNGYVAVSVDSRNGNGIKTVNDAILAACAEKLERDRKKGIQNRPVRAMICGIPNVGKSTFINKFAKKAVTETGNKPGVTKGKQWIRLNPQVELLDTPGILWPKFEDQEVGKRIAWIGSINDEILITTDLALDLINFLLESYPDILKERYGYELEPVDSEAEDAETEILLANPGLRVMNAICRKRGCIRKGNEPDYERCARMLIDEFRQTKIGKISLEKPGDRRIRL